MSLDDVKQILGEPHLERDGVCSFAAPGVRVDYPQGAVTFFEVSWHAGRSEVIYKGVSVFDTLADDLVEHISGARPDREDFEFRDRELDLALWRPMLPKHYDATEPEDEYRNGKYWMAIAIGSGGVVVNETPP